MAFLEQHLKTPGNRFAAARVIGALDIEEATAKSWRGRDCRTVLCEAETHGHTTIYKNPLWKTTVATNSRIDMMMSAALADGEMVNYKRRNANRPSVIYFHGHLNKDDSTEEMVACPGLVFGNGNCTDAVCDARQRCEDGGGSEEDQQKEFQDMHPVCCESSDSDFHLPKRHRTSFTSFQLKRLEEEFDRDAYIIGMKRWRLAVELEVPEKQVKIWFQNRRTKLKKHCSSKYD